MCHEGHNERPAGPHLAPHYADSQLRGQHRDHHGGGHGVMVSWRDSNMFQSNASTLHYIVK